VLGELRPTGRAARWPCWGSSAPLGERRGGGLRPSRERHGGEARWAGCWSATARSKSEAGVAARLVAERRRGASTVGPVDFFYYAKILNRNCFAPIFLFWDVKIFLFKFFQLISQKNLIQIFSRQFYSISPTFF
jgi:hypothetical protein